MMLGRDGRTFRATSAALWAATWGAGAAIGVVLGGWLTVVGGAGAPGARALDVGSDLVALPAAVFGVVWCVHFIGQLVAAGLRGAAVSRAENEGEHEHAEHDGV